MSPNRYGLLDRLSLMVKAAWRPQTLKELDDEIDSRYGGFPTYTGVPVSENTALTYTAVYACVRVRAEALAMLSLHLYRRKGKGAEKAVDHPLYTLIHDRPNAEMSSFQWRLTGSAHHDTWGNSYSWLDIATTGRSAGDIRQVYPLKPDRVRPYRDPETNRLKYEYKIRKADGSEKSIVYDMSQIFHVPGLGYDGLTGYSPVALARQAIGLGLATEELGARFFGQGTHVGGVVSFPNPVNEQQVQPIREAIKRDYAGLAKSHGLMVLPGGGQFKPIDMPLEDAQFLQTRQWQLGEIARMYRVPPHLIGDLSKATFSNIEQQALEFAMYTMIPYCKAWEQALNMKLLTESERRAGYYFEFDLNSLMRGDAKSRAEFYKLMREAGAYNPNMILQKENENPREDPGGEKYWDTGPSGQKSNQEKELSEQAAEDRLKARLEPVKVEAWARIQSRERKDIQRESDKWARRSDPDGFTDWLGSFFPDHEEFCSRVLTPYYQAIGFPDGAAAAAKSHMTSLKAGLFGLKPHESDRIRSALEGIEP